MSARKVRDPGSLSLRVEVLEPIASDDAMGGSGVVFTAHHKLWAAFKSDGPALRSTDPARSALATGQLTVRLGKAPAVGWRVAWVQAGVPRTLEVEAVEPGSPENPFDVCALREVTP